jgi:4-hydroxy-3-methylbut-2-enyl diphosphate reductase
MEIRRDNNCGFCFGVEKAVEKAFDSLVTEKKLYCLGEIVHNRLEVDRLSEKGLKTISRQQYDSLKNATVLIRAHGEPPETYLKAKTNNLTLVDATCPVVKKLQKKVADQYAKMKKTNGQMAIYGKKGHAETIGLNGQTDNNAIIIQDESDLSAIDFSRPLSLVSQTTMGIDGFLSIKNAIAEKYKTHGNQHPGFTSFDSICRQVSGRADKLAEFATGVDVLIFVSGHGSSNGRILYEAAVKVNPHTHLVESAEELEKEWFDQCNIAGISGATSTPVWLMDAVEQRIRQFEPDTKIN